MPELLMKERLFVDSEIVVKSVIRLMKRDIFERYKQTGEITDEDWEFCEKIDWHPVDELPLREEFIEDLKKAKNEPSIRLKSISDIFE